ncbi:MAG: YfiR family protein, partial [Cytophagales bacterium]|nr:YfiR family protein [Cytophagales bacterium]
QKIGKIMEKRIITLFTVLALALLPRLTQAQFAQLEANYLLNFAYFTVWPTDFPTGNFEICILGSSEMTQETTDVFAGKTIMNHPVKITSLKNGADLKKMKPHIVYLSYELVDQLDEIMNATLENGSLVVVEAKDTKKTKPVIAFVVQKETLKFAINMPEAKKRNLKFQDQMVKLSLKLPEFGVGQ